MKSARYVRMVVTIRGDVRQRQTLPCMARTMSGSDGLGFVQQGPWASCNHALARSSRTGMRRRRGSLLHRMKLPVLLQAFDGGDLFAGHCLHGSDAGPDRRAVNQDCAGPALSLAEPESAPGQFSSSRSTVRRLRSGSEPTRRIWPFTRRSIPRCSSTVPVRSAVSSMGLSIRLPG